LHFESHDAIEINMKKTYNILFLCTHNSARSILGEALATTRTHGRFIGYSAGSSPGVQVNPFARELALELGYPADRLRSKSWDEFSGADAPIMDFIITVCDNAAGEVCPVWLGHPVTAHWGFPDPSRVAGTDEDKRRAFRDVMVGLNRRIDILANLPIEQLDHLKLQEQTRALAQL
jgi:arsenate reductase (thioredoxin)